MLVHGVNQQMMCFAAGSLLFGQARLRRRTTARARRLQLGAVAALPSPHCVVSYAFYYFFNFFFFAQSFHQALVRLHEHKLRV